MIDSIGTKSLNIVFADGVTDVFVCVVLDDLENDVATFSGHLQQR